MSAFPETESRATHDGRFARGGAPGARRAADYAPDERVALKGVDIDALSEPEVVQTIVDASLEERGGWVCSVNLDILRQHDESAEVRELVADADLVLADGMPLVWASQLAGTPLPERVAGSALMQSVPAYAAERGARIFLLGGNRGAAEAAAEQLTAANPGLQVVGTLCPPVGFEDDEAQLARIDAAVAGARPHVVFVGLGFPKQEHLIQRLRGVYGQAWYVSCGISLSFAAGEIKQAPPVVRKLGLEWLHRLVQEPRRLWRRYVVDGPPVLARLFAHALRGRFASSR